MGDNINNSLINMNGLSDVLIDLNNKMEKTIGWIACNETPKRKAVNIYIEEIKGMDIDPLTKAALISNAKKTIREYSNQNSIYQIAIQMMKPTAMPQKIEDEWLMKYMDRIRNVSSEEFQYIWGKILARECNNPGCIPISLIYALERMDKEDAQAFIALCRITVRLDETCSPVFIERHKEMYKRLLDLNYDRLINLRALGFIEMDMGPFQVGYSLITDTESSDVTYFNHKYSLENTKSLKVGNVIYTKIGQALAEAIEVDELEDFWENICLPFFNNVEQ